MARYQPLNTRGFTLIELLVVLGIITVLFGLASINLVRPQNRASVQGIADTLVADIKSQQLLSMVGEDGQTASPLAHGIYMTNTQYTLFAGEAYSGSNANNFVVTLDSDVRMTTTFASSQVIFAAGDGAVQSYTAGSNSITLANTSSGDQKMITIGRYGAVSVQ